MVRAKRRQEFLSPTERADLESQKKDLERTLEQSEGFGAGGAGESLDKSKIRKEISRLDNVIGERTPVAVRAQEKDALLREEKEIEEALQVGMPTDYEMRKPHKNPGAVRKHVAWEKRNLENIERYRTIQRILRPMEPKSIESLRKDR